MKKLLIISIVYLEPEWQETFKCLKALEGNHPVYYVERKPKGIGSLAEAINRGFRESRAFPDYEYVWFVTNVTFPPDTANRLLKEMDQRGIDVLHPAFDSDHLHMRGTNEYKNFSPFDKSKMPISEQYSNPFFHDVVCVPFVEFTAAMVRADVFNAFPLDESMPYWGHDPDHGVRLWRKGFTTAVHKKVRVNHVYIRNNKNKHLITAKRLQLRRAADAPTKAALRRKYGANWHWMFPRDQTAYDAYWELIAKK